MLRWPRRQLTQAEELSDSHDSPLVAMEGTDSIGIGLFRECVDAAFPVVELTRPLAPSVAARATSTSSMLKWMPDARSQVL